MPITTWKIMLRRAVGEQIELVVDGRTVKWTIAEIFRDHSTREGRDIFSVRVDETEGIASGAAGESL